MKNYLENIDRESLRAFAEELLDRADDARDHAVRATQHAVDKAHGFSLIDYTVLGICLTSFGAWVGSCLSKYAKKCRALLVGLFAASWAYLFWRVFIHDED